MKEYEEYYNNGGKQDETLDMMRERLSNAKVKLDRYKSETMKKEVEDLTNGILLRIKILLNNK